MGVSFSPTDSYLPLSYKLIVAGFDDTAPSALADFDSTGSSETRNENRPTASDAPESRQ